MKMFKPDCYELLAYDLEWILDNPVAWQNRAYKAWKARLDKVDEWLQNHYPHGAAYNRLNNVWEDLYKRCATIKYPDSVIGADLEDHDIDFLLTIPRGSFMVRKDKKMINGYYNNADPLRIQGKEGEFY